VAGLRREPLKELTALHRPRSCFGGGSIEENGEEGKGRELKGKVERKNKGGRRWKFRGARRERRRREGRAGKEGEGEMKGEGGESIGEGQEENGEEGKRGLKGKAERGSKGIRRWKFYYVRQEENGEEDGGE